jgi:hypothetical protein
MPGSREEARRLDRCRQSARLTIRRPSGRTPLRGTASLLQPSTHVACMIAEDARYVEDSEEMALGSQPPAWLGEEVTGDLRYDNQSLAIEGCIPED